MSKTIPGPDSSGPTYGFSETDAARVGRVVRRTEGYYLNAPPARTRYPTGAAATGGGLIDFKAGSGGIASGSFTSPSSATVSLYKNGTGAAMTLTGATTVTAYNQWGTAVAANMSGKGHYRNGFFYVVVWNC